MSEIEQERGKPISDVLIEMFDRHGSQEGIARELGVSQPTISQWMTYLRLKRKTILILEETL